MTKQLGLDDYLEALEKMKKSRRDRIGQLGEVGVPVTAAVAGGLLAWAIGAASLVSVFGYTFLVVSNPIGWVVGGATVAGTLGYFFATLARSGGKFDTLKNLDIQELEKRIAELSAQADKKWRREPKFVNLISSVQLLVANGRMSQDTATAFIAAVQKKHLTVEDAFRQVQDLALEQKQRCSKGTKREPGHQFVSWMRWPKLPKFSRKTKSCGDFQERGLGEDRERCRGSSRKCGRCRAARRPPQCGRPWMPPVVGGGSARRGRRDGGTASVVSPSP